MTTEFGSSREDYILVRTPQLVGIVLADDDAGNVIFAELPEFGSSTDRNAELLAKMVVDDTCFENARRRYQQLLALYAQALADNEFDEQKRCDDDAVKIVAAMKKCLDAPKIAAFDTKTPGQKVSNTVRSAEKMGELIMPAFASWKK
jgi:hypothetical protein